MRFAPLLLATILAPLTALAGTPKHHHHHEASPPAADLDNPSETAAPTLPKIRPSSEADCNEMQVWDFSMGMCMPLPMADMPMKMLMVQANSFFSQSAAQGPRGHSAFSIPNFLMADLGTSIGDHHYLNLDVMTTFEKWTFRDFGYPLLMQIGEERADGTAYIDAQHPHSSPIMGITLSDTIAFGNGRDHAKIWFSPRGQSTDGPIAFMHRPTGLVNPDAPLGHHIGQDAGHITSTVIGASARISSTTIQASTFHGAEPQPTRVDLPFGTPDSYAARAIQQLSPDSFVMASVAYVKHPEHHDPDLDHIWRYSASIYHEFRISEGWRAHHSFIYGMVKAYDHASSLNSFGDEFWAVKGNDNIFTRVELLQRTPNELAITNVANPNSPRWVSALTAGYTRQLFRWDGLAIGLGGSITKNFLPESYRVAYNGNPWSGRIFLQAGGMEMWHF